MTLLAVGLGGCIDRDMKAASDGKSSATPAALVRPSAEDAQEAMEVFAELLPELSLPEQEIHALMDYEQKTGRSPCEHVKAVWQRGDYPDIFRQIGEVEGWKLTEDLVPFDRLSRKERLLLWMDWTADPGLEFTCWQTIIARMNIAGLDFVDGPEALKRLWHTSDRQELTNLWLECERDRERFRRMLEHNWLPRFASPVSGRFFEPWHPSFSAGNGYIRQIMAPDALERIANAVRSRLVEVAKKRQQRQQANAAEGTDSAENEWNPPRGRGFPLFSKEHIEADVALIMSNHKFFYFRVYGEQPGSLVAEGLWRVIDYQNLMQLKAEAAALAEAESSRSALR